MRRYILAALGIILVEFIVAPFGGRVFNRVFPEERGIAEMMPDIPFYQWAMRQSWRLESCLVSGFLDGGPDAYSGRTTHILP